MGHIAVLTVLCLLVHGEYPFTPDYVRRLHKMVTRYCDRPFKMYCFTDQPDAMPDGVEPIQITKFPDCYALWNKLQCFNPAHGFTGRMLFLDLDVLIVSSLAPIIDFPADFALTEDIFAKERAHDLIYKGRRLVRKFNSSVMVWDGGEQEHLFTDFTHKDTVYWSTDQDLIAFCTPWAVAMPQEWFPRISQEQPPWRDDVKVVLVKKPKGTDACEKWPWLEQAWGGW